MLERLEARQFLSTTPAVSLSMGGTLTIRGTDAADTITFSYTNRRTLLTSYAVTINGAEVFSRKLGPVPRRLFVDCGGGNDTTTLAPFAGPATVLGGAGNDTLTGTSGDNSLFGGDGNDSLNGGPGNDLLSGDAGDDTLFGDHGRDTLLGGAGNDTWHPSAGEDTAGSDLEARDNAGQPLVDDDLSPDLVHARFFQHGGHTFLRLTVHIDLQAKYQLSFGALTRIAGGAGGPTTFDVRVHFSRRLDYVAIGRPYIPTDYRAYYDLGPVEPGPHSLTVTQPDGTLVKQFDFSA
jgi:Ca2+-binding RTX toxin-like protein